MTEAEAAAMARDHLVRNPFPEEGFRWVLDAGVPIGDGWYFDYLFERTHDHGDLPPYAGAKGFLVTHDGGVRDISWPEWQRLQAP